MEQKQWRMFIMKFWRKKCNVQDLHCSCTVLVLSWCSLEFKQKPRLSLNKPSPEPLVLRTIMPFGLECFWAFAFYITVSLCAYLALIHFAFKQNLSSRNC